MRVTKEDYFNYSGLNLELEFKGTATDNPSNYVNIFIKKVETFVVDYVTLNYSYDNFNEEVVKKAILEQIDYVLLNNFDDKLCAKAKMTLKLGGMGNIVNGTRYKTT